MDNQYTSPGFNTKMRIVASLDELAQVEPFEQVSVLQICEKAGISRSTFYHHFCDKNAVLQWHSSIAYRAGIDQIGRSLTWLDGHLITTRALERYKNLYYRAGYSNEYSGVRPSFVRHRTETLRTTLTDYQKKEITPLLDFQICAVAATESAVANRRYSGELVISSKEYCTYLLTLIPKELYEATKDPVQPRDDGGPFFLGAVW